MVNWECKSCDQLVPGCNTCDNTKCLTCKSDFDMVSKNGLKCLPKFENCVIPIANQNFSFFDDEFEDLYGNYRCPQCLPGYYWVPGDANGQGMCTECYSTMPNCNTCFGMNRCSICDQGYFLNANETQCVK
jgi:hypothetical protein